MKTNLRKAVTPAFVLLGFILYSSQYRLTAQQNIVQNGSFEAGWQNNAPIDWGWTYNVSLAWGFSGAADGRNFAEVYGTLFQILPTTPGQEYQVEFALAGNFNVSEPNVVNVLWGGTSVETASWNPAGHTINNLGWVWVDFDVTAHAPTTQISFDNPFVGDGSQRIPKIDAITVEAVGRAPVPDVAASAWLLGFGLLAVVGMRSQICSSRRRV